MKRIKCDKIILKDSIFNGYVFFDNGKIVNISDREESADEQYDMTGYYLSPGFVDIHTHGGGGYPFDGSVDDIINACDFHMSHGTTSICPTISADSFDVMSSAAERVFAAMHDKRLKSNVIGAHMEGPYLSKNQAGAQCPAFITAPNEEEYLPLLEKMHNVISRWTYAPENDADESFAKALQKYGVVASAGHTDAIYGDLVRAKEYGCKLITHLYSCTSTITRDHGFRRLGVIETAYLLDDMFVEIICDGKHLPPDLIKLIYKIKGSDRIALVTDSLSLAGTSQKHGFMQNTEYIIEDGVCKLMDRSAFAGSIATADRLVRVAVKEAGIDLVEAVKMITKTPATIMNLETKGEIAVDKDADFVVFDQDINVKNVFVNGNIVSFYR